MTKKHLFRRLLNKAVSMALWTKARLCGKSSLLEQCLPRLVRHPFGGTPSRQKPNQCNLRNLRLKNSCQFVSIFFVPLCLSGISTTVKSPLQIKLFMQNKAKFRKVKLNVNKVLTRAYEQMDTWSIGKKQSQTNPNKAKLKKAEMNVTSILTVDYENKPPIRAPKKQSQTLKRKKPMQPPLQQRIMNKTAISGPGKTNPNKPNFRQFQPISEPI
jgi:hypothetical protein